MSVLLYYILAFAKLSHQNDYNGIRFFVASFCYQIIDLHNVAHHHHQSLSITKNMPIQNA